MKLERKPFTLKRDHDTVLLQYTGDKESFPVKFIRHRPISALKSEISILHATQNQELVYIGLEDTLDNETQSIINEEIEKSYFIPVITKINSIITRFGIHYWDVETSYGPKVFLLRSPAQNIEWKTETHCMLKDTMGVYFEIPDYSSMDASSQSIMHRII